MRNKLVALNDQLMAMRVDADGALDLDSLT